MSLRRSNPKPTRTQSQKTHGKRNNGDLYNHLRTGEKRYSKRVTTKDNRVIILRQVDIPQHPKIVEYKTSVGDLEIDAIIGKNHQEAIITVNNRVSGLCRMKELGGIQFYSDKSFNLTSH